MRDIPIIYSAPMVLALLEGRKTMTRRLAWKMSKHFNEGGIIHDGGGGQMDYIEPHEYTTRTPSPWQKVQPGDRLWVKENFWRYGRWVGTKKAGKVSYAFQPLPWAGKDAFSGGIAPENLEYAAGADDTHPRQRGKFGSTEPGWHLRPNIFLERKHSRLTLTVASKKIERLQDISEEDAKSEGVEWEGTGAAAGVGSHYAGFCSIWTTLHGLTSWYENPDVVSISFIVHHCNIDALVRT